MLVTMSRLKFLMRVVVMFLVTVILLLSKNKVFHIFKSCITKNFANAQCHKSMPG